MSEFKPNKKVATADDLEDAPLDGLDSIIYRDHDAKKGTKNDWEVDRLSFEPNSTVAVRILLPAEDENLEADITSFIAIYTQVIKDNVESHYQRKLNPLEKIALCEAIIESRIHNTLYQFQESPDQVQALIAKYAADYVASLKAPLMLPELPTLFSVKGFEINLALNAFPNLTIPAKPNKKINAINNPEVNPDHYAAKVIYLFHLTLVQKNAFQTPISNEDYRQFEKNLMAIIDLLKERAAFTKDKPDALHLLGPVYFYYQLSLFAHANAKLEDSRKYCREGIKHLDTQIKLLSSDIESPRKTQLSRLLMEMRGRESSLTSWINMQKKDAEDQRTKEAAALLEEEEAEKLLAEQAKIRQRAQSKAQRLKSTDNFRSAREPTSDSAKPISRQPASSARTQARSTARQDSNSHISAPTRKSPPTAATPTPKIQAPSRISSSSAASTSNNTLAGPPREQKSAPPPVQAKPAASAAPTIPPEVQKAHLLLAAIESYLLDEITRGEKLVDANGINTKTDTREVEKLLSIIAEQAKNNAQLTTTLQDLQRRVKQIPELTEKIKACLYTIPAFPRVIAKYNKLIAEKTPERDNLLQLHKSKQAELQAILLTPNKAAADPISAEINQIQLQIRTITTKLQQYNSLIAELEREQQTLQQIAEYLKNPATPLNIKSEQKFSMSSLSSPSVLPSSSSASSTSSYHQMLSSPLTNHLTPPVSPSSSAASSSMAVQNTANKPPNFWQPQTPSLPVSSTSSRTPSPSTGSMILLPSPVRSE